jgi:CP family cyanate transporter-like MFS transporter
MYRPTVAEHGVLGVAAVGAPAGDVRAVAVTHYSHDPLVLLQEGGLGTAVVGPILPMFLRDHIPLRMVTGTSAYAGGTIMGSALGALLAVPLALAFGGWRESVLALSILSSLCIAAWLILVRPGGGSHRSVEPARSRRPELPRLPVHRPVAWAIGLLFGLQSWLYYGTTAWLASIYIERGWPPADAAVLLSVVSLSSLTAIVMAPAGARRGLSRRSMLVTSATAATLGLAGVAVVPGLAFVWAVVLGGGLGLTFTLLLTLPTDLSDDPREIGGAAALMLLVGYVLASIAPFALGAARDATGDFAASVWILVAIAAMMVPLAWSLSPHRLRRDRTEVRMPG